MRLSGVHVLVTRPRARAQELCSLLEREGARVTSLPLLELLPPDDPAPLRAAARELFRYRWVLFASAAAVSALVEEARQAGTLEQLARLKLAAVGPATARAVEEQGLTLTQVASRSTGLGLFEAIRAQLGPGEEVLLPQAQEGRRELEQALEQAGVRVRRVAAYQSEGRPLEGEALDALLSDPPQVVLLCSPRTAEAFLQGTGTRGPALLQRAKLAAIGPTTASALEELGISPAAVASRPTAAGLVEAVVQAVAGNPSAG